MISVAAAAVRAAPPVSAVEHALARIAKNLPRSGLGDAFRFRLRDFEYQPRQASGAELFERRAEQWRAVVAVVADQRELAAGDDRPQAVFVVLHLMQPAVAVRRLAQGETI